MGETSRTDSTRKHFVVVPGRRHNGLLASRFGRLACRGLPLCERGSFRHRRLLPLAHIDGAIRGRGIRRFRNDRSGDGGFRLELRRNHFRYHDDEGGDDSRAEHSAGDELASASRHKNLRLGNPIIADHQDRTTTKALLPKTFIFAASTPVSKANRSLRFSRRLESRRNGRSTLFPVQLRRKFR